MFKLGKMAKCKQILLVYIYGEEAQIVLDCLTPKKLC